MKEIFENYSFEKTMYGEKIIKDKMWDVFDEKFENVKHDLENFRINGLTCGIEIGLLQSDRDKLIGNYIDRIYKNEECEGIIKRYNNLKELINDENFIKNNIECEVGNPQYLLYDNFKLNICDMFHIYDLWQITRLINKKEINCILEIGGGFGMLANKLLNNFNNIKYISIDLPETLILQHYYLSKLHPKLKIVRYKDILDQNLNEIDFDILLIPPFDLELLNNLNFDLVINCRGFSEMNGETLKNYFNIIQNRINNSKYFYLGSERYMAYRGIDPIGIRNYPFDDNWTPIISQPSWLVSQGHDFLLKRDFNPLFKFSEILKSFPICTPPPSPITKNYDIKQWLINNKVPEKHIF